MKFLMIFLFGFVVLTSAQEMRSLQLDIQQSTLIPQTDADDAQPVPVAGKKSVPLAILYSALLPGMGELYGGNFNSGKYFTGGEVVLWLGYIATNYYTSWQEDNYKSYAAANGGVNTANKDADFFANVGNYTSVNQYNDEMAFRGRFTAMYNPATHYWNWDSQQQRQTYRGSWVASKNAENSLSYITGAMILNRVASIINAVRIVNSHNKSLEPKIEELGILFNYAPTFPGDSGSMQMHITVGF